MKKSKKGKNSKLYWLLTLEALGIVCLCIVFVGAIEIQRSGMNPPSVLNTSSPTIVPTPTLQFHATSTKEFEIPSKEINTFKEEYQGLFQKIEVFDLENANPVPPDNILEEVSFYAAGGTTTCPDENPDKPYFHTLAPSVIEIKWLDPIELFSCGWKQDEIVELTIIFPDTTIKKELLTASWWQTNDGKDLYAIYYDVFLNLDTKLGEYRIRYEGESGIYEQIFNVYLPSTPHFYTIDDNDVKYIVLYGFSSGEIVHVINYDGAPEDKLKFAGWNTYQVDQNGRLLIKSSNSAWVFFVIGDISGLIENSTSRSTPPHDDIIKR